MEKFKKNINPSKIFYPSEEALKFLNLKREDFSVKVIDDNTYRLPIDSHIHSLFSDGVYCILDIVGKAKELDLKAISITDHDNINCSYFVEAFSSNKNPNIVEFNASDDENVKKPLYLIPGCEITCKINMGENKQPITTHLNCFGFDKNNEEFKALMKKQNEINKKITFNQFFKSIENFIDAKVLPQNFDKQCALKKFKQTMADKSKENGKLFSTLKQSEIRDFFINNFKDIKTYSESLNLNENTREKTLFDIDLQCYDEMFNVSIQDVIQCVHNAGGYCILAHPLFTFKSYLKKNLRFIDNLDFSREMCDLLLKCGLDGVEYCKNSTKDTNADKFNRYFYDRCKKSMRAKRTKPIITAFNTDVHLKIDELGLVTMDNVVFDNYLKYFAELLYNSSDGKKTDIQKFNEKINSKTTAPKLIIEYSDKVYGKNKYYNHVVNYIKSLQKPKGIEIEEMVLEDFLLNGGFELKDCVHYLKKMVGYKKYKGIKLISPEDSKHAIGKKRAYQCTDDDIELYLSSLADKKEIKIYNKNDLTPVSSSSFEYTGYITTDPIIQDYIAKDLDLSKDDIDNSKFTFENVTYGNNSK